MAALLPLGVARTQAPLVQGLLLFSGNFVVGDGDALAATAVLAVQAHHRVGGGAGARKEVDDYRIGLAANKESDRVFDRVERAGPGNRDSRISGVSA